MTRFANLTPNANRTIWVLLPKVISPCLTRVYDRCKRLVVITPTNCPVSHTNHFRQSVSQFRRLQYLIKKSIYRLWSGLALARCWPDASPTLVYFSARLIRRLSNSTLVYFQFGRFFQKLLKIRGGGRFRPESQLSIES